MSKSHRQAERDSGTQHQRVGKMGSSGRDSSRGESDKEGGGGEALPPPTWGKKAGQKSASSTATTSSERVGSSSPLPSTTGGGGHVTSRLEYLVKLLNKAFS